MLKNKNETNSKTSNSSISKIFRILRYSVVLILVIGISGVVISIGCFVLYRTVIVELKLHGIVFIWGLVTLLIVIAPVAIKHERMNELCRPVAFKRDRIKEFFNPKYNLNCMVMHLLYVIINSSSIETMIDMNMASKDYFEMLNKMLEEDNVYLGILYTMLLLMLVAETYVDTLYLYDVIKASHDTWYRWTMTYVISGIVISLVLFFLSSVVNNAKDESLISTLIPLCASMTGIVIFKYVDKVIAERLKK